jgi:hypothetical protein
MDRHHVGVLKPRDGPRFLDDARPRRRIRRRAHELDRDRPVKQRVMREVDLTGRAGSQRAQDPELLELVGRPPAGHDIVHDPGWSSEGHGLG